MKKILLIMALLVLFVNSVEGSRSIPLDFNEKESYTLSLYIGDRVIFEFDDDNHTLILDDIKSNRVEFDVFIYQERNKKIERGEDRDVPLYIFADTINLLKFDLDRDDMFDFELDLLDYDSKKALFELSKINEVKDVSDKPKDNDRIVNNDKFYKDIWFIRGVIGLVALIILGIIINRLSRKNTWSYH